MSHGTTSTVVRVTPVVSTSIYTAGNVVGGLLKAAGVFSGQKSTGILQSLAVTEKGTQKPALILLFFSGKPAGTFTDGAALTLSAADLALVCGHVVVASADYSTPATSRQVAKYNPSIVVRGQAPDPIAGAADLYFVAVATGTPTFAAADDLGFGLGLLVD